MMTYSRIFYSKATFLELVTSCIIYDAGVYISTSEDVNITNISTTGTQYKVKDTILLSKCRDRTQVHKHNSFVPFYVLCSTVSDLK